MNAEESREYQRAWREKNRDRIGQYGIKQRDRELARLGKKRRVKKTDEQKWATERNHYLMHKYGISLEQFNHIFDSQHGLCATCGKPLDRSRHPRHDSTHVDHDHETGQVRGILCGRCNRAIGSLRDSSEIAKRAADYLKRFRKRAPVQLTLPLPQTN